jgi:hypothetical protein
MTSEATMIVLTLGTGFIAALIFLLGAGGRR